MAVISRSDLIRWMTSLSIWKGPDPQLEHGQLFWPPQPISMLQITVYVSLHLGNLFSFTDCRGDCQPDWSKAAVLTLSRLTNAWWFEQQGKAVCNEPVLHMVTPCTGRGLDISQRLQVMGMYVHHLQCAWCMQHEPTSKSLSSPKRCQTKQALTYTNTLPLVMVSTAASWNHSWLHLYQLKLQFWLLLKIATSIIF